MEDWEIVQAMIDGSEAINIMRERTKRLMGMVESYLHKRLVVTRCITHTGYRSEWMISASGLRVWRIPNPVKPGARRLIFSNKITEEVKVSSNDVQELYEALPDLIEALRLDAPSFMEDFQPYLNAAKRLPTLKRENLPSLEQKTSSRRKSRSNKSKETVT